MAGERSKPPHNRPPIVPPALGWTSLLSKDGEALKRHYDHVLQELAKKPGMLGGIFKRAKSAVEKPETPDEACSASSTFTPCYGCLQASSTPRA